MARRSALLLVLAVAIGPLLASCDSGDGGAAVATTAAPEGSVATVATTTPPEASPFCQEMRALDDRLEAMDDDERPAAAQDVLDTYTRLEPVAPVEISAELEAVRRRIERELAGETLSSDEVDVADDAAERLSQYVLENCDGVVNNPGPPATPPA